MPRLQCAGLKKVYGGRTVVNDVGFHVERGEIVGLLGPNGAGKTTSFRMTCGMITPTAGKVTLDDVDVTNWPMYKRARQGMGYLAQESSVFVKLTVEQNILAILEMLHVGRRERLLLTAELLEQFGLTKLTKALSSTLSGGERRRLEIARCLASKPTLILLDEPFTGIDPVTIQGIQEIIRNLKDRGIGILLTDHREMETLTITDRNYIICNGRVLIAGNSETVLRNEEAQRAYFGKRSYHSSGMLGGDAAA
jgi:lipopolysaccharide export system ATP-binding protein